MLTTPFAAGMIGASAMITALIEFRVASSGFACWSHEGDRRPGSADVRGITLRRSGTVYGLVALGPITARRGRAEFRLWHCDRKCPDGSHSKRTAEHLFNRQHPADSGREHISRPCARASEHADDLLGDDRSFVRPYAPRLRRPARNTPSNSSSRSQSSNSSRSATSRGPAHQREYPDHF